MSVAIKTENGIITVADVGGSGGNADAVILTKEEYDALPDTKLIDNKQYFIKDWSQSGEASGAGFFGINTGRILTTINTRGAEWVATEDAYAYCYIQGAGSGHTANVRIGNTNVMANYNTTMISGIIPIKKGQTLKTRAEEGTYDITVFAVKGGGSGGSANFYDNTETAIGIWFGKTLYRKVIEGELTPNDTHTSLNLGNIDVIKADGYYMTPSNNRIYIGGYASDRAYSSFYKDASDNKYRIYHPEISTSGYMYKLIIEYTKD